VRASAPLALARAWTSVDDRSEMVAHWVRVARVAGHDGPLPGGPSSVDTAIALLQATIGASGARAMAEEAAAAYAAEPDASPWRALACLLGGAAAYLLDDTASATATLAEGVERSGDALPSINMLCETWLAAIPLIADAPEAAERHVARAVRQVERAGLEDSATTGLLHAVRAMLAARAGDADAVAEHMRVARLRLAITREIFPGYGIVSRVLLGRAAARTGDPQTARTLLREAQALQGRLPDSPVTARLLAASAGIAGDRGARSRGTEALTTAELRVLTFLPTHLTLKEIALRLGSSPHTVKSQAAAVYRKLGASSRSEAVDRARQRGLIEA
jgi:LuxR family maltose regulon positive regulatory protein